MIRGANLSEGRKQYCSNFRTSSIPRPRHRRSEIEHNLVCTKVRARTFKETIMTLYGQSSWATESR